MRLWAACSTVCLGVWVPSVELVFPMYGAATIHFCAVEVLYHVVKVISHVDNVCG